jgi:hypothetical protein
LIKQLKKLGSREEILINVYRSLGLSHFNYSAPLLSSTNRMCHSEMASFQKRILRIIDISAEAASTKYGILPIDEQLDKTNIRILKNIINDSNHPITVNLTKSATRLGYALPKPITAAYNNSFMQKYTRVIRDGTATLYTNNNANHVVMACPPLATRSSLTDTRVQDLELKKPAKPQTACKYCGREFIGIKIHITKMHPEQNSSCP